MIRYDDARHSFFCTRCDKQFPAADLPKSAKLLAANHAKTCEGAKQQEWLCGICDEPIERRGGAGRQRDYCSANCRKLKGVLVQAQEMIAGVRFNLGAKDKLRREFWALANLMNSEVRNE